jgi:hypothetical protein
MAGRLTAPIMLPYVSCHEQVCHMKENGSRFFSFTRPESRVPQGSDPG